MIEGKPDDAAMKWAGNELEKDALRERISRLIAERDEARRERDALREKATAVIETRRDLDAFDRDPGHPDDRMALWVRFSDALKSLAVALARTGEGKEP